MALKCLLLFLFLIITTVGWSTQPTILSELKEIYAEWEISLMTSAMGLNELEAELQELRKQLNELKAELKISKETWQELNKELKRLELELKSAKELKKDLEDSFADWKAKILKEAKKTSLKIKVQSIILFILGIIVTGETIAIILLK